MKTQLAVILLAFASEAAAYSLRGVDEHNHRRLSKKGSGKGDAKGTKTLDNGVPYRVIHTEGKKTKTIAVVDEDGKDTVYLKVKKADDKKSAQCASSIAEIIFEEYAVNAVITEKVPNDLSADDVVAEIDGPDDDECEDILGQIEEALGNDNKRSVGGGDGTDSIAVYTLDSEDDKCYDKCDKKKKDCENSGGTNCDRDHNKCKDDCAKDCKSSCRKNWGIFEGACEGDCRRR